MDARHDVMAVAIKIRLNLFVGALGLSVAIVGGRLACICPLQE